MPDTGAPWNIPYVAGTDLVADWPTDSQTLAQAIADGLTAAGTIKQIVRSTDTTNRTTTSQTFTSATISVTITPQSADNMIYVYWYGTANASRALSATACNFQLRLHDGSAAVEGAEDVTFGATAGANNPAVRSSGFALLGRYNPATTAAVTFTGQFAATESSITVTIDNTSTTGQLIAMEVAE